MSELKISDTQGDFIASLRRILQKPAVDTFVDLLAILFFLIRPPHWYFRENRLFEKLRDEIASCGWLNIRSWSFPAMFSHARYRLF